MNKLWESLSLSFNTGTLYDFNLYRYVLQSGLEIWFFKNCRILPTWSSLSYKPSRSVNVFKLDPILFMGIMILWTVWDWQLSWRWWQRWKYVGKKGKGLKSLMKFVQCLRNYTSNKTWCIIRNLSAKQSSHLYNVSIVFYQILSNQLNKKN